MNYSTAIFLINPKVRAIAATYEFDDKTAPRTVFKTFDQTLTIGDYIVVPTNTRHNMTVCKVVETDLEADLESSVQMQWIIGTIDKGAYDDVLAQETRAIDLMKAAEKTHAREELRKKMMAHVDETQLNALQITRMTGDGVEVIEQPKPAAT
jgi:hypothetical protein